MSKKFPPFLGSVLPPYMGLYVHRTYDPLCNFFSQVKKVPLVFSMLARRLRYGPIDFEYKSKKILIFTLLSRMKVSENKEIVSFLAFRPRYGHILVLKPILSKETIPSITFLNWGLGGLSSTSLINYMMNLMLG